MRVKFSIRGDILNIEFISNRGVSIIICRICSTESSIAFSDAPLEVPIAKGRGYTCYIRLLKELWRADRVSTTSDLLKCLQNSPIQTSNSCASLTKLLDLDKDALDQTVAGLCQSMLDDATERDTLKRIVNTVRSHKFWKARALSEDTCIFLAFELLTCLLVSNCSTEDVLRGVLNLEYSPDFKMLYKRLRSRIVLDLSTKTELDRKNLEGILPL
jgi:hypothetical protein